MLPTRNPEAMISVPKGGDLENFSKTNLKELGKDMLPQTSQNKDSPQITH